MTAPTSAPATAPDIIEPVVGFRQWRLAHGGLRSLYNDTRWTTAEIGARCPLGRHDPLSAPAPDCSCGIYAYHEPPPWTASAGTLDFVTGAVIVWGTIEVHDTGLRAEHARIIAIALPLWSGPKHRQVIDVARRLVVAAVAHRQLRALALSYGLPLERSMRPPRNAALRRVDALAG